MPSRKKSGGQVYVARDSGHAEIDGIPYAFHRGDRVAEGHPLLKLHGSEALFEPADAHVRFEVEQATAAPGETRDVQIPDDEGGDEGLEAHTVVELQQMARDQGIEGYSTLNKAELVAALEED